MPFIFVKNRDSMDFLTRPVLNIIDIDLLGIKIKLCIWKNLNRSRRSELILDSISFNR